MSYVKRISGNVKRGVAVDLDALVLLTGPNAAGKTAVATAIELALTGRSSEVGAQPTALMELASAGDLAIAAELSEGTSIEFKVSGTTARAHTPIWTHGGAPCAGPVGTLLMSEIREILTADPKRRRAAIMQAACGDLRAAAIAALVPEAFRAEWEALWAAALREHPAAADALVAVRQAIRDDLRRARGAAKRDLGERPGSPSTAVLRDLEAQAAAMQASQAAQGRYAGACESLAWLESAIARLEAAAAASGRAQVSAIEREFAAERATALASALHAAVFCRDRAARAPCLCCSAPGAVDWPAAVTAASDRAKRAAELAQAAEAAAAADPAEQELAGLRTRLAATREVAAHDPGPGLGDAQLSACLAALAEARKSVAATDAWDGERKEQVDAASRADVLTALLHTADRAISESLDGALADFCARAPLANGAQLAIDLHDRGREVCRIGVRNGDGFRSWRASSGAERAELLGAMAAAWGRGSTQAAKVVIVDDAMLDAVHLGAICAVLGQAVERGDVTQAIVCNLEDYGIAAAGWRRIKLA